MSKTPETRGRKPLRWLLFWYPVKKNGLGTVSCHISRQLPNHVRLAEVGTDATLDWTDENGQKTPYKIKILARDTRTEAEQLKQWVNAKTGEFVPSGKDGEHCYPDIIIAQKKVMAQEKRITNKNIKTASKNNSTLGLDSSIFSIASPTKRRAISENSDFHPVSVPVPSASSSASSSNQESEVRGAEGLGTASGACSCKDGTDVTYEYIVEYLQPVLSQNASRESSKLLLELAVAVKEWTLNSPQVRSTALLLQALADKMVSLSKSGNLEQPKDTVKLADHYFQKGIKNDKVQLFPTQQIYVFNTKKLAIDLALAKNKDWKWYCDTILINLYGDDLKWMSTEGKRSTAQRAIHESVRDGLYDYAKDFKIQHKLNDGTLAVNPDGTPLLEAVTMHDMIAHINRHISNKKQAWRRANKMHGSQAEQQCKGLEIIPSCGEDHKPSLQLNLSLSWELP